jgi:hypothetical protein
MAKTTTRRAAATTTRVKTAVYLSPGAAQRLGAASVAESKKRSDIVEILINRHLAGYVLSVRGERISHSDGSANSEVQTNSSQAAVP